MCIVQCMNVPAGIFVEIDNSESIRLVLAAKPEVA